MAENVSRRLMDDMMDSFLGKILALIGRDFFNKFKKTLDYAEYGGAPILGIKGVGIVCHGSSSARAIKNAIMMAMDYVETNLQEKLAVQVSDIKTLSG